MIRKGKRANLVTFKWRIVISVIFVTFDADLRRLHINGVARKVGKLLIWFSEEECRVLASSDTRRRNLN